jgi:hypothetical protein
MSITDHWSLVWSQLCSSRRFGQVPGTGPLSICGCNLSCLSKFVQTCTTGSAQERDDVWESAAASVSCVMCQDLLSSRNRQMYLLYDSQQLGLDRLMASNCTTTMAIREYETTVGYFKKQVEPASSRYSNGQNQASQNWSFSTVAAA